MTNDTNFDAKVVGLNADKDYKHLLSKVSERIDYHQRIGTELRGIQLSELSDEQIEDLAAFISARGVVFFRDQDLTPEAQVSFAKRLGDLQPHVHSDGRHDALIPIKSGRESKLVAGEVWHTDMPEISNPPAFSILMMETLPPVGGDTLFMSMYAVLEKFSPSFLSLIEGRNSLNYRPSLKARPEKVARDDENYHPIVRTHPVTGWKSLYCVPLGGKHISGLTPIETKYVYELIEKHTHTSLDCHVRYHWEPNSIAIWDNRCVQHNAVWDYWPHTRIGRRVVVKGEKPFYDPNSKTQSEAQGLEKPAGWSRVTDSFV